MISTRPLATEKLKEVLVEQGEKGASLRVMLTLYTDGGAEYVLALEQEAKWDDMVVRTEVRTEGVSILIDSG
jgi:Fe-S cluster assembly iron-binding protein IscA